MMLHLEWNLEKALWILRAKNPSIDPCQTLMESLFALELNIFGKNSLGVAKIADSTNPPHLKSILRNSPTRQPRNI